MIIIRNVNPTRSELSNIKSRIKTAELGYGLLKRKRDRLIAEFYEVLSEAKKLRHNLDESYIKARHIMLKVVSNEGLTEVKNHSLALKYKPSIELKIKNIMGVSVPEVHFESHKKKLKERGYGLISLTIRMEELAFRYGDLIEKTVKAAEIEIKIRKILEEIEKTKRRVNALEYNVIPRLYEDKKFISIRLEEIEREGIFVLKMIKNRIDN